jgi:hypothetical protein
MNHIIADPNFSTLREAASKWAVITHKGVKIFPTVEEAVLRLDISHTSGANWHGELRYSPFAVVPGAAFAVSFSVRAKQPFTFSVWLGQRDSPYKSLVPEETHFGEKKMTSDWQTFRHIWRPVLREEAARLNFVFGQIDNTVEIKDVMLTKNGLPGGC